MTRSVNIALEISDNSLSKKLLSQIQAFEDVHVVPFSRTAKKVRPDIVIIDDNDEAGAIFNRLRILRDEMRQSAVFLVSADASPQRIVEMMKSGISEYLMLPIDTKRLHKAVEEVRAGLSNAGKVANGSVYSFISSKGGLGSTVISVNTAVALAAGNKSEVVLCDMSMQSGDASVMLDVLPETTIMDISQNFHRLDVALLRGAMIKTTAGLDFLAAPVEQEDYQSITAQHVEQMLGLAKKIYDYIVIDCTSMFINECTVEAFNASKKIFVVTDLSVPAIRNTARLIHLMHRVGVSPDKIDVVVNRYIKGGVLSLEDVEQMVKQRIFWLFPNDFDDIVSSINHGVPLVLLHPHALFSNNILHFVEKLQNPQSVGEFRGIRGTFGKII